jgi:hypothetical protein
MASDLAKAGHVVSAGRDKYDVASSLARGVTDMGSGSSMTPKKSPGGGHRGRVGAGAFQE